MADLTQQYLDILRGYGVDTSTLQYADPAKLKRIVDQTRQAPDTGGGAMAVGQQAAQQAAKDVIGGTTPRQGLEDLLKEAHTGPSITQAGSDAALPMSEVPAMSAPRELAIRQDPGGPQSQGDINQPTSLGVKTSTATLRPDTVTGEVPAPGMELQPGIYDHLPAYEPTEDLITKAMTGPTIKQAASDTVLPMSEATVQPLAVDARIEERRLRREQEQEAARLAKQPKAQIAPGQTLTLAEGPAAKKKKNMLQTLAGIEVVKPGAEDWGTQFEGATSEELDTVGRQVLGQDVENVRDGGTPMTTFQPDAWSSKGVDPRIADIWGELTGAEKEQYLLKYGGSEKEIIRAIEENVLPSGAPRVQRDAAVQRPLTPVSAQKTDTTDLTMDTPEDVDLMDVDLEGMAPPEKRGLLSRLGGFAQDNPELLAQIAQAGGGFMQNIAQGRAQKKADAKTRGAMAQSNLIGALTGGKSRPAVMREEAEQGGLLARLGQAVEAGGRVAGGEMQRRTALSQRDEEMGLKGRKTAADELNAESQKAYREAMAGVYEKQLGVDDRKTAARLTSDYLKAAENQRKDAKLPVKQITELASQFSTLNKLDSLEDFIVGADFSALEMGPLSLDEPSQFIFGTDPRIAQGKIQGLIMEIAQSVPGVLTEQDQKRLEQILFTMNDRPSTALDIADAFRQAKIEGLTTQLGGLKEAGGYDVSYFERQIQDYGKDKGKEGLTKLLQGTKLELD